MSTDNNSKSQNEKTPTRGLPADDDPVWAFTAKRLNEFFDRHPYTKQRLDELNPLLSKSSDKS